MALRKDVKDWQIARKKEIEKRHAIENFLNSTYEQFRKTIDGKSVAFWRNFLDSFTHSIILPINPPDSYTMGIVGFTYSCPGPRSLKVDMRFFNEAFHGMKGKVPTPGPEYLENVRPELTKFGRKIHTDSLCVADQFENEIEIVPFV